LCHHAFFGGRAGACSIAFGVSCRMDLEGEEISWSREVVFLYAARKFSADQRRRAAKAFAAIPADQRRKAAKVFAAIPANQRRKAAKVFAAIKTALPFGSSLVASCRISEINPTQGTRIKIQAIIRHHFAFGPRQSVQNKKTARRRSLSAADGPLKHVVLSSVGHGAGSQMSASLMWRVRGRTIAPAARHHRW
jgi:hypothetical protein